MTSPDTTSAEGASERLRIGVVGTGYLGKFHARIYNDMPDVNLVGIADIDEDAATAVAKDCGDCPTYTDSLKLLDKVDAVSIVVPTEHHLEVSRPFLEKGIHMLLEKPVAPSYEESLEIVELAEKSGAILQIGHLERYNAGVMALAERVKMPRFIEVHRLGPFVARATDVDVVTDLMIHDIDIVMALVGSPIRNLSAMGTPVITDHIDIANARIEFENGAVANVSASRVSNKKFRRIRVFERDHYYGLDYTDQRLDIVTAQRKDVDQEWPEIVTEKVEIEPRLPLNAELEDFINNIRNGSTPLVTGRVGLEALRVALLVKEKMAECLP
ncbi:MAG: Gfo/Idh/MocA family oxidoreductase [Acidiferrobacterales bacterium]